MAAHKPLKISEDYEHRISEYIVQDKIVKVCGKLGIVARSPKTCRKTFRTTLINARVISESEIELIMGHRTQSVGRKYYDEIVIDTKKDAGLLNKAFGIFFPEKQPETDP